MDVGKGRYMQEKNIGYLKNFEFLLNKSKANYVMYSDHDDIWHEDKIEKCLKMNIRIYLSLQE